MIFSQWVIWIPNSEEGESVRREKAKPYPDPVVCAGLGLPVGQCLAKLVEKILRSGSGLVYPSVFTIKEKNGLFQPALRLPFFKLPEADGDCQSLFRPILSGRFGDAGVLCPESVPRLDFRQI